MTIPSFRTKLRRYALKNEGFFIFLEIYQQLLANCVIIINVNKAGQKRIDASFPAKNS